MYSKLQANTSIFIIRETAHKSKKALELGYNSVLISTCRDLSSLPSTTKSKHIHNIHKAK